jgi:hypothetical protein
VRIIKKLKNAGLQLNIDKCEFKQKKVKYLEYIINSKKGICVDPEKVEAIRTWEPPSTIKGVRGFLGFANYYRKFIPRFLSIAQSLTDLTKKDVPFQWRNVEQKAFLYLKKLLINAFILAPFDSERETGI